MELLETRSVKDEERHISLQPVGHLFGRFGLLSLLAGVLLAAWFGQVVIVILLCLVLSAAGLAWLWSRFSLAGVTCQRLLCEQRVFPGEKIQLKLRLVNRKLMPLPWVTLHDEIPDRLSDDSSLSPGSRRGGSLLTKSAALLWYTGVSWNHCLSCRKRGYYALGPMTVTSGDIFGFYSRSVTVPLVDHVIVYPEIFPIDWFGIPFLHPIGETIAQQRIFEDPVRVIGVRDYRPHDSLRRIHWKASARHQNLQVKVFESTTTLKVVLFLAVDSFKFQNNDAYDDEDFELGISAAASIANHFIMERHSAVGLFANSRLADSGESALIPPAGSDRQLVDILEALAKVTYLASIPFEEFLQAERPGLPWGTTIVIILSAYSPSLAELLKGLKNRGNEIMVLQVGGSEGSDINPSIAWHIIRQPGDLVEIGAK